MVISDCAKNVPTIFRASNVSDKVWSGSHFYLIYLIGILFFIVNPALEKNSLFYAIAAGGFLGLLCDGTYDLTNLATIANWPVRVTVADLIWGTFVTATVSGITVFVAQHFNWK